VSGAAPSVLRVSKDARFYVEVAKPGMAQVC
jgi:hypothetical protein